MKKSLVSVIVPIYNVEKYLPKCIDSILEQTYKNLEVILVDDGSKDNCGKIIDEYAKKDKRIIVIHQKNGGQSRARNVGIEKAKGEFISFVDGDDEIGKSFIEELVEAADGNKILPMTEKFYRKLGENKENSIYTARIRAQGKREKLEEYVPFVLAIDGRLYSVINKLFDKNAVQKYNIRFKENSYFAEDTRFVLQYIKAVRPKLIFIQKPLYIYNFGTENSTVKRTSTEWNNWRSSFNDLKEFIGKKPSLRARFWMLMVLTRWKISYLKSRRRAKK